MLTVYIVNHGFAGLQNIYHSLYIILYIHPQARTAVLMYLFLNSIMYNLIKDTIQKLSNNCSEMPNNNSCEGPYNNLHHHLNQIDEFMVYTFTHLVLRPLKQ